MLFSITGGVRGRGEESREDKNRGRESRYIAVSHGRETEKPSRESKEQSPKAVQIKPAK